MVPACASTSSLPQKASLEIGGAKLGLGQGSVGEMVGKEGSLANRQQWGLRAQETLLKLKLLLGYTFWMALTPLFTWPGTSPPVAIRD